MHSSEIQRHKTAIRRNRLSRPVSALIENGLLKASDSFFDYGCGHGQDIELLKINGFENVLGYDPYFRADAEIIPSKIVNLGFVLNVIENPKEREQTLRKAFSIAENVLCVSVMTTVQQGYEGTQFSDGVLSSKKTFQKYYEQSEIKNYLESTLEMDAIPVSPGIFFLFKNEVDKLDYLQSKFKNPFYLEIDRIESVNGENEVRREKIYRPKISDLIKQSPLFENVINFLYSHGRYPKPEENEAFAQLTEEFKSKRAVVSALENATNPQEYEEIRNYKKNSLLVFFALRRFDRKGFPKGSDLPVSLTNDISDFFGSYLSCRKLAEQLLFKIADDKAMAEAFKLSTIGKVLPDALYIHPSFLPSLPPLVQIKVGIAQKLVGDIDECNLIKINKFKNKVSFLVYEDFDTVEHPALLYSLVMDIPKNDLKYWEFRTRENPPILHRKETFVSPSYPRYQMFAELTKQEVKAGLLEETSDIGTRNGWSKRLQEIGYSINEHQLKKL